MPAPGRTTGGIGGHVRHCLDHVSALLASTRTGLCAYDRRQRGTDVETWRALLLLLARSADETRSDGGIGTLWSRSGGPSIELQEIDYAEVLRERRMGVNVGGSANLRRDPGRADGRGGRPDSVRRDRPSPARYVSPRTITGAAKP